MKTTDSKASWYERKLLPRCLGWGMGLSVFERERGACLEGLSGTVLELGFGAGHNLPFYPAAVRRVLAVEPSDVARKLAAGRIAAAPMPVEFVGFDGAALGLDAASVDGVACTWTLCSIGDVHGALEQMVRVLKPNAKLHFFEHGLSSDPMVARSQQRWNGLQKRLFGGCHLNRDIEALLSQHFSCFEATPRVLRGPKAWSTCLSGQAWNPA